MQWMDRRGLEVKAHIKPFRDFVEGMDKHGTYGDDFSCGSGAQQGIFQQSPAETGASFSLVNSQSCQENHANGVIGRSFGDSRRCIFAADAAGRK